MENLLNWTRDSQNRLMFTERIEKYALFKNPQVRCIYTCKKHMSGFSKRQLLSLKLYRCFLIVSQLFVSSPVPYVSYLLPVCYRIICWGGKRHVRWLNETKRLCWRLVCFLNLHTTFTNASSPGGPLESFRLTVLKRAGLSRLKLH